ncbi:hypothetical protein LTR85_007273 [Meristemomyces frigidus]|nr:hypothetical protein LTR85_007273 [Meristemomyces frigidus]
MGGCHSTASGRCLPTLPTPTVVTNLCKQKAGFVAHRTVHTAGGIRICVIFLLIALTIGMIVTAEHSTGLDSKRVRQRVRTRENQGLAAASATVLLGLVAFALTTYVYAVNHQFYCEAEPKWQHWNSAWVLAGFVPGFAAAVATLDWAFVLANNVIIRTRGPEKCFNQTPGVILIFIVLGIGAVAVLGALGTRRAWFKAPDRATDGAADVELGHVGPADESQAAVGGVANEHDARDGPEERENVQAGANEGNGVGGIEGDMAEAVIDDGGDVADVARPRQTHAATFPHRKPDEGPPAYTP